MTNLFLVLLFCPCLSKKSGLHLIYQHLENAFSVIILPLVRRKMETTFRNIDNAKMFTQLNSYNLIFKLLITIEKGVVIVRILAFSIKEDSSKLISNQK